MYVIPFHQTMISGYSLTFLHSADTITRLQSVADRIMSGFLCT